MQTATVDLLDVDPFDLVADEVPWDGRKTVTAHLKHDQKSHGRRGHGVRDALMAAKHVGELAQAAKKEAKRITGRDISFRFKGSQLEIAREHAEGILVGLEHFPKAPLGGVSTYGPGGFFSASDFSGAVSSTAYAVAMPGGYDGNDDMILFNTGSAGSYRSSLKRDKVFHFAVTDDPTGVALHEFGHVVDHYGNARGHVFAYMRKPGVGEKKMSKMAREGVSHYAATNLGELTAEAFADVMANGEDASPLSRELFGVLEDAYRRRVRSDALRSDEVKP